MITGNVGGTCECGMSTALPMPGTHLLLLGIVGAVSLIAIFSDSRTPPSQSP